MESSIDDILAVNVTCRTCRLCNVAIWFCNRKGKIVDVDEIRTCESYQG